jgi:5-deoxy-glucuronate isomerase
MQYGPQNLLVHPGNNPDPQVIVEVTPERAGWETIRFQARRLNAGSTWSSATEGFELALVVLSGTLDVNTSRGAWQQLGTRRSVFEGLPTALYLPRFTDLTVTARTDCEFALAWASATLDLAPRLISPSEVKTELRGGDQASRHINSLLPPGFPCERLVVVEVFTPGGNWSSYPPHKHDVHKVDANGHILEADLDEIYYYKIDRPEGYAFQRVYTDPESPLQQAGQPIDCVLMPQNNDVALIPEGYHPVASPPGYTTYYLNVLVGSAQSLAATDDPAFTWVKGTYHGLDPRVPLYPINHL